MEDTHMVNKDLFEVYIPAADRVVGAYRDFTEALNLTRSMYCEVHIRKNLQLECKIHARNNPNLEIKKEWCYNILWLERVLKCVSIY